MPYEELRTFPPLTVPEGGSATNVDTAKFRELNAGTYNRIGLVPSPGGEYVQKLMVLAPTGGIVPAGQVDGPFSLAGEQIYQMKSRRVGVASSMVLVENLHLGVLLRCSNTSEIVLTVNRTNDPDTGVTDGFWCMIMNANTGGVRIQLGSSVSTALTFPQPDGHSRVLQDGKTELYMDDFKVRLWGYTVGG